MFRKKVKKAFTLVELLVVIAILAILATVSVVGYTQFTKRAQQSNDMSLTTQINTVLQADEVTGKPEYPTQAMAVMEEAGANIAELSPTTEGYSYVYNLKTNRVILLDGDKNVVAPEDTTISDADKAYCYAMVHSEEEKVEWVNAGYSVYLSSKFTGTTVEVDKAVGVDVGESNVTSVSITGTEANTATIYTNGGTLSVNAAKADVNFYGEAENVDVQAVKMGTFNVYGTISNTITLTKGKVAVKNDATVPTIKVADTAVATEVAIEADSTATLGAVVAPDSMVASIKVPQNTEVVSASNVSEDFAGGVGTEASPYLIDDAESFQAIGDYAQSMNEGKAYYFKLINDVTLDFTQMTNSNISTYFNGQLDGNGYTVTLRFDVLENTAVFEIIPTNGAAVIKNVDVSYQPTSNGYGVNAILVDLYNGNLTFDSVNVYGTLKYDNNGRNRSPYVYYGYGDLAFYNCEAHVDITADTYNSAFVGYAHNEALTIKDSANYGTLIGTNIGMVYGNLCNFVALNRGVTLENVVNYGKITGYSHASLFGATSTSGIDPTYEQLLQQQSSGKGGDCITAILSGLNVTIGNDGLINITAPSNENDAARVAYYEVRISQYVDYYLTETNQKGGTDIIAVTKTVEKDKISETGLYCYQFRQLGTDIHESVLGNAKYIIEEGSYTVQTSDYDNNIDIITDGENCYYLITSSTPNEEGDYYIVVTNPKPNVMVYAYDANGAIIGVAKTSLK